MKGIHAYQSGADKMEMATFGFVLACFAFLGSVQTLILQQGKRLDALGRLEAKLDLLLGHSGVAYDPFPGVSEDVAAAIRAGNKIEAIKLHRQATGASLAEAKKYVESLQARLGSA
jgi:hypothetical protein